MPENDDNIEDIKKPFDNLDLKRISVFGARETWTKLAA